MFRLVYLGFSDGLSHEGQIDLQLLGKSYYPTHYPTQSPIDEMSHVSPTSSDQCSPTLDEFVDLAGESK